MPKTLTLRNVPDRVVRRLRQRARRGGRSMQAELLSIVERATLDEAALVEQLRACRALVTRPLTLDDIEQTIREGRP